MSQPKTAKPKQAPAPTDVYTLLLGLAVLALLIGCVMLYVDLGLHQKEGNNSITRLEKDSTVSKIALLEFDS